ncbi:MAG: pantoate--beta-alanine ligase [Desulfofustis sp.]|nr:pantoate--beta-alanine ligase [Desulfofustis sp.]
MSSRNVYLTPEEKRSAGVLYKAMQTTREAALSGADRLSISALLSQAKTLISSEKSCTLEYFTIVDEHTLLECDEIKGRSRAMGALRVNEKIRLIDNMPLY